MYVDPKTAAKVREARRKAYGHSVEAVAKVPTEADKRVAAQIAVGRIARAGKK